MNMDMLSKAQLKPAEPNFIYGKGGSQHSYSHQERRAFVDYINYLLQNDEDLKDIIPINKDSDQIFHIVQNGVLLCKFVNALFPGAVPESKIVRKKDANMYEKHSNLNHALHGALNVGCNLVNINADDIYEGKPHIVLGFFWTVIRTALLKKVNLDTHPELVNILQKDEDVSQIKQDTPEKVLLKWFNFHLKNAKHPRTVDNFGKDISDGENYLVLLEQIAPHKVPNGVHKEPDPVKRAQKVCELASELDALKFITPDDIINGNQKLNLAFTAYLFHKYPGLQKNDTSNRSSASNVSDVRRDQATTAIEDDIKKLNIEKEKLDKDHQRLHEEKQRLLEEQMRYQEEQEMLRQEATIQNTGQPNINQSSTSSQQFQSYPPNNFSQQPPTQPQPPPQPQPPYQQTQTGFQSQYQPGGYMNTGQYQQQFGRPMQTNPIFTSVNPTPVIPDPVYTSVPYGTYINTSPIAAPPPLHNIVTTQPVILQSTVPSYTVSVVSPPPPPPPPPPRVIITTTTTTYRRRF